jgi:hypothetical protein
MHCRKYIGSVGPGIGRLWNFSEISIRARSGQGFELGEKVFCFGGEGFSSIAFPSALPPESSCLFTRAIEIACRTVLECLPKLQTVKRIRFVFPNTVTARMASSILDKIFCERII